MFVFLQYISCMFISYSYDVPGYWRMYNISKLLPSTVRLINVRYWYTYVDVDRINWRHINSTMPYKRELTRHDGLNTEAHQWDHSHCSLCNSTLSPRRICLMFMYPVHFSRVGNSFKWFGLIKNLNMLSHRSSISTPVGGELPEMIYVNNREETN